MFLKPARFYVIVCLLLCSLNNYAQDAITIKKLDELKKQNNLTEWLYTRNDYANTSQGTSRLPYLMNTQKEVWRQPANLNERMAWLTILSSQGYNQLQSGDILTSINCYEEAYRYYYKYKVAQFDIVEYVLKPLGNNYTRLGDNERALFIQQKSLARLTDFDNNDDIASVYSNMAITHYTMGNYAKASECISTGIKYAKDPTVYNRLQNTLVNILIDEGKLPQAQSAVQNLITLNKPVTDKNVISVFNAYGSLGNIYIKNHQLNEAGKALNRALQLATQTWFVDEREKAATLIQLGTVQRMQQQPLLALKTLDQALRLLHVNPADNKTLAQKIYGEHNLVDIFHEKALAYRQLKQDEPALQNIRYALLALDKIRSEFADNKTKERLQQDGKTLAETAIEMALSVFEKTKDKQYFNLVLEVAEQTKARTLADQLQRSTQQRMANSKDTMLRKRLDLERAIAYNQRLLMEEANAKYQKKIDALKFELALLDKGHRVENAGAVLTAKAMLAALPADLQVVEYFFGGHGVYAINIKNGNVQQVKRIGNADSLRQQISSFINTYYSNGPAAMLNSPKEFYQKSNLIYKTLLGGQLTSNNARFCIVADDVLGYLSFDGLITGDKFDSAMSQWPYLIKKITTTYVFSLNTLLKNKPRQNRRDVFSGLFVTHEANSNTPITAVKKEASAIKGLIAGDYNYDEEVNSQSFFKAFDHSAVLHISTHAYLSGVNKEPTLDFGKEKLFLFELLARQNRPNLVVLSACRTGDGLLAKGEGIISLSRGFSAIGTPATIAGLWNVNDDAVAQITANTYKGLLGGQSSGTALHQAKLTWLSNQQASDAMYLPYYWDSLILMGADEPVHLQKAHRKIWWYIVIGVVLASLVVGKRRNA